MELETTKKTFHAHVKGLQDQITQEMQKLDPTISIQEDLWDRFDHAGKPGGGGITRAFSGELFESAGVNTSCVFGAIDPKFAEVMPGSGTNMWAAGISLILHPRNPRVPTVHANFRMIHQGIKTWFGGGADLTPYYLFEEDAVHFHQVLKANCDKHNTEYYPEFKKNCDKYFHLAHRQETRGIGVIFFDYQGKENPEKLTDLFSLVQDLSRTFVDAYVPIADQRKGLEWTPEQKKFQLVRRGRYVEVNLIYDRGTIFGLKTGGRIESILMSLPAVVNWDYDYQVAPNTEESKLLDILKNPREWL